MKTTRDQILQRCKDIVDGNYPENGREIYGSNGEFTISYNHFFASIRKKSAKSSFEQAEFLLGMDQPPAEITLEWEQDEYQRITAKFNDHIECSCFQIGTLWFAFVKVNQQDIRMPKGRFDLSEAQQWCLDTIKSIVTPKP